LHFFWSWIKRSASEVLSEGSEVSELLRVNWCILSEYMNRNAVSDTMACCFFPKDDLNLFDYSKTVTTFERGGTDQEAKAEDIGAWMEIGADRCATGISSSTSSCAQE